MRAELDRDRPAAARATVLPVGTAVSWATSARTRKTMQSTRSRDTAPELALRSELHRRGLRFRVCSPPIKGVRRSADVVFRRQRIAVFLDGCFWHGCPTHYIAPKQNDDYWSSKLRTNQTRDADTDHRLREAGWSVVRIWEHVPVPDAADQVEAVVRRANESAGRVSSGFVVRQL